MVGLRANRIRIEVGVRKTGVRNRDGKAFVEFFHVAAGLSQSLVKFWGKSSLGQMIGKKRKREPFLTGQNNTIQDIASGSVVAVFRCNSGNNANVGIR